MEKNYCQCVLLMLGTSREKMMSGAASPLLSADVSVSPECFVCQCWKPIHTLLLKLQQLTNQQALMGCVPRPILSTINEV